MRERERERKREREREREREGREIHNAIGKGTIILLKVSRNNRIKFFKVSLRGSITFKSISKKEILKVT